MIAPLLWLLLAALGATAQYAAGVEPWAGRPPVVVTAPAQPQAGKRLTVTVAALPRDARAVRVVAGGLAFPAHRTGSGLWRTRFVPPGGGGPLAIAVRFRSDGTRYEAPGAALLVAPGG